MYNAFDRPLRIELRHSRLLALTWLLLYLLAAGGLYSLALDWPLRVGLLIVLSAYAWFNYRLHVRLDLAHSVSALDWDSRRGWRIRRAGGWEKAEVCTPVLVTRQIAALRLRRSRWNTFSVLITGDRTDADEFRRLRVRLIQSAHGDRNRKKIPGAR